MALEAYTGMIKKSRKESDLPQNFVSIRNPYRGTETTDRMLKSGVVGPQHFEDLHTNSQKNDSQLIRMGLEQFIEECD